MSPELRIIAGIFKGRKISSVASGYRPTAAIVKKSLFDMLGEDVRDSRFLDLFSGTGAVGLEALSRGAGFVCFVENDWSRIKVLNENLKKLEIDSGSFEIMGRDYIPALQQMKDTGETFDIIYIDPPYHGTIPRRILGDVVTSKVLAEDGLIVYEAARNDSREILTTAPGELYPLKERDHGGTALLFFRWRELELRDNQGI